jgi:hypothetical protein
LEFWAVSLALEVGEFKFESLSFFKFYPVDSDALSMASSAKWSCTLPAFSFRLDILCSRIKVLACISLLLGVDAIEGEAANDSERLGFVYCRGLILIGMENDAW